jgi:hypothetical protein
MRARVFFRMSAYGSTWHFCPSCSQWPRDNFTEQPMPPGIGDLCSECTVRRAEGKCADPPKGERPFLIKESTAGPSIP